MKQYLQISSLGCGFNTQNSPPPPPPPPCSPLLLCNFPEVVHTYPRPLQVKKSGMSPNRAACTWQLSHQGRGHQLGLWNHHFCALSPAHSLGDRQHPQSTLSGQPITLQPPFSLCNAHRTLLGPHITRLTVLWQKQEM